MFFPCFFALFNALISPKGDIGMKPKKLVLIIVILACIGLTMWQFNNLKIIFHEYSATHKYFYHSKEGWQNKTPLIDKKTAKTDPEAAAIVNFIYKQGGRGDEQSMDMLAENISRFPENQYFLYELAACAYFGNEEGLDANIMLKLSDRLLELDNKNSNYYYLKAYALLHLRRDNNFDEVIETIKKTANCEYHKDPYLMYIDRIIAISQIQGLPKMLMQNLEAVFGYNFYFREIYDTLIRYENLLITENDYAKADEISNTLELMIPDKLHDPLADMKRGRDLFYLYGLGYGYGRWGLPQEIELQRKDLTPQAADQKRMELCTIVKPDKKVEYGNKIYELDEKTRFCSMALLPFLYFVGSVHLTV